jgi:hypothetical protein
MIPALENWRNSATRRAEFAALLQEPAMQDAIAIMKEIIFTPINPPLGLSPVERMAYFGEMGLRREASLGTLKNFLDLAAIVPLKEKAKELQKKKPWDSADRKAGEAQLLSEFYGGNPPPLEGAAEEPALPVSPEPQTPQE